MNALAVDPHRRHAVSSRPITLPAQAPVVQRVAAPGFALVSAVVAGAGTAGAHAAAGASMTLPLRATATVTIKGVALPIVGAVLGALLFGLPGAAVGAVGGYLLSRA